MTLNLLSVFTWEIRFTIAWCSLQN